MAIIKKSELLNISEEAIHTKLNELRKEMSLSEINIDVQWFRPEGAPNVKKE